MTICEKIKVIENELPQGVKLVAVSKFQPLEYLQEAYAGGTRAFGENRPQEFAQKVEQMPLDTEWHFIGHLQTNKVKLVVGKAALIHSMHSEQLLECIQKEAAKLGIIQKVLVQVHVAQEESKSGFFINEVKELFSKRFNKECGFFEGCPNVRVCGVMGMATNTDDMAQVRREFRSIRQLFDLLKESYFADSPHFKEVSMGMSGDYKVAIEEGTTIVRVGSAIFPPRIYK